MRDETAVAEQMIQAHGIEAHLRASETAAKLDALGDDKGAARWRRVMAMILEKLRQSGILLVA